MKHRSLEAQKILAHATPLIDMAGCDFSRSDEALYDSCACAYTTPFSTQCVGPCFILSPLLEVCLYRAHDVI